MPAEKKSEESLLETTFAITNAPSFNESEEALSVIKRVINEVRGGYGGTLVCEPKNGFIDSPVFLAHYLRAFSKPAKDLKKYDYRFERILARLSQYPETIKDPRLDWDVFRAFLVYENDLKGKQRYEYEEIGQKYSEGLSSPKDLLWSYIDSNADAILKNAERLKWWITNLTQGIENPKQYPLRGWYALELVSLSDTLTAKLITDKEAKMPEEERFPTLKPDPYNPFLIIDKKDEAPKTFKETIQKIAQS